MNNIFEHLEKEKFELLVVSDEKEAQIASSCASYLGYEPFVLSDFRANYGDDLNSFSGELKIITKILEQYHKYKKQNKILIAPVRTISYALPKKECFEEFNIEFGETVNISELKDKLYNWGYVFVDIVTSEGEVSIRGDIIDIYFLEDEFAYRISLFDDEVESIRLFDVETQKSQKEELEEVCISPAFLSLDDAVLEQINEKIDLSTSDAFVKDIHSLGFWYLDELSEYYLLNLKSSITKEALDEIEEVYIFEEKRIQKDVLLSTTPVLSSKKYTEINPANINGFLEFHKDKKITVISNTEAKVRANDLPLLSTTKLSKYKVKYSTEMINLLSNEEVIISLNKEVKKRKNKKPKIIIDELQSGDYVVHEIHGIGKFKNIEPVTIMGSKKDFVIVEYLGDDRLLIPVENIDLIDRYVASSGGVAVLDKLGKGSFAKLKSKVKERLFAIASDIIKLAAQRELTEGIKIDVEKEEISILQSQAGFVYTKDQTRSIQEFLTDISSGMVMDRLLSGDVGFGKTEVALSGILATILSGHQSIFVCPTTLLASQHYLGLKKRLEKFDVKVAKLDGRTSAKDKTSIKKAFEDGTIDFIVGTHSLLNIKCKNLGLVVIDEEHKFGVKQKEKLKDLRSDVHIYSMSATPIPRTLNLALSKIKGMSSLLTPPSERLGVRSYVKEYDDKLIKEIILREKRRGGQIFYVYNNIATIESKKSELKEILPNATIKIIHSKINLKESEKIIEEFSNGEFDILLATSIIESGLHLPNANSMIIDGASRFGIADLHQLRGRVGRSNKEGFCYFIVEDKKKLTDDAVKRLLALETNSYLGSGTALAHQDLEIRGGGNIIGEAQSGHIKHIGYALYLKMLEDAIATLSGDIKEESQGVDIKLTINAFISSDYVSEDKIRLELYRRLSRCDNKASLFEIQDEMEDRFGKLDTPTKQFIELILIKILAISKNIKSISNYEVNISFNYNDDKKDMVKSSSKDDDDIVLAVLKYLNAKS
ncbi:MAG TPA: transcription-repair coupling factor [Arcobacter sp.]|nr:transcription-repair coupling factor [Arcobacter sp.]